MWIAFLDRHRILVTSFCVSLRTGFQLGSALSLYFSWCAPQLSERSPALGHASIGKHSSGTRFLFFVQKHIAGFLATLFLRSFFNRLSYLRHVALCLSSPHF